MAKETTRHAVRPKEPEAAHNLLGPMGSNSLGEKSARVAFQSKDALGLRFVPRAQFRFAECSFPKRVGADPEINSRGGPSRAGEGWVAGPWAIKAFSSQISLLPEGEHVWSGFQSTETTHQSSRTHGARGSPDPPWPYGNIGPGEN